MAKIPAPRNKAIEAAKAVLDKIIEGVGPDVAISAGKAQWSFLGLPVVRLVFGWSVNALADYINANLFHLAVKVILRVQSTALKDEFNKAIKPIIAGSPTSEEIERARKAAIDLIQRNRGGPK